LRDVVVPRVLECETLIAVDVGRKGPDQSNERIMASIWESGAAMREAIAMTSSPRHFDFEITAEASDASVEVLPLSLTVANDSDEPAQILRCLPLGSTTG
jgi:hypothetical protein